MITLDKKARKLQIENYSFGRMTIGGKEYRSDLILYPDGRIQSEWWRTEGHNLLPEDISELLDSAPRKIIIGTGASGQMSVSDDVRELCRQRGIDVEAAPTSEAMVLYNHASESGEGVAACFHLTC